MEESLLREFQQKTITPEEAAQLVRSGDTVYVGAASSIAYGLCEALGKRADELNDVTIASAFLAKPLVITEHPAFRSLSFFVGAYERKGIRRGSGDFTSVHLSSIDIWCRNTAHPDVAFLEVSPPDDNGYMSYGGTGVALHDDIKDVAKTVVLQINRNVPDVYGERNAIHISDADYVVYMDTELAENKSAPFSEEIHKISGFLVDQVPDGACIQLGLGGVSEAVGMGLMNKNDLGGHTELMTDSMMQLMKAGVMNNKRKTFMPGCTVAGFTFGSQELYRFIHRNRSMYYMPFTKVNNPAVIAKNDNMVSINTAISVDLFGQVNADNICGNQYSGVGGQVDFVRGAQMSRGGRYFIAIPSTANSPKLGYTSKIVAHFPEGTAVTTPRSDVQYIVTEYGCVNLKPLSMKDRIHAMIGLAHPDFREQLRDQAKDAGWI